MALYASVYFCILLYALVCCMLYIICCMLYAVWFIKPYCVIITHYILHMILLHILYALCASFRRLYVPGMPEIHDLVIVFQILLFELFVLHVASENAADVRLIQNELGNLILGNNFGVRE